MSMDIHTLFEIFVAMHIITGAPGLISFWVPILAKKGGANHKKWGKIFTFMMLATGFAAIGISITTIIAPVETHPHLMAMPEFSDPETIRGIFGWMMLYLAILTVNLAWYGWQAVNNKRDHLKNRVWHNLIAQLILAIAAIICVIEGILIDQVLMIGISTIGFATVATNLWFMFKKRPQVYDWLNEHIKALVGAGISVYTAFFAFGAVRLVPELALQPALWAVPLVVGVSLIVYHQHHVRKEFQARRNRQAPAG